MEVTCPQASFFLLMSTLVFTSGALSARCALDQNTVASLKAALENDKLKVEQGKFFFYDISRCEANQANGCYFQNPTSPYGLVALPLHGRDKKEQGKAWSYTEYQLEQNEAVFLFGCTPPEMEYFSFTPYLYNRCLRGKRYVVYGSIGDSVNIANIKTSGGEKFGSPFALAMTGDSAMSGQIQKVLRAAHVGRSKLDLNVLPLPESVYPGKGFLKYGTKGCSTGSESDSFQILARFAGAKDEVAWTAWKKNPTVLAFRVSADTTQAQHPYPAPTLTKRRTSKTEQTWKLRRGLQKLKKQVLDLVKKQHPEAEVKTSIATLPALKAVHKNTNINWGGDCYIGSKGKPLNCQGDSLDTVYFSTFPFFKLASLTDEVYVVGVNHAATDMSTYSNIALMNIDKKVGVTAVTNQQYAGSAMDLLQRIVPDDVSSKLFAVKLAYNCTNIPLLADHCFVLPSEGYPNARPGSQLAIFERGYLNPYTNVGPSYDQILPIKYIWVKGKPN